MFSTCLVSYPSYFQAGIYLEASPLLSTVLMILKDHLPARRKVISIITQPQALQPTTVTCLQNTLARQWHGCYGSSQPLSSWI